MENDNIKSMSIEELKTLKDQITTELKIREQQQPPKKIIVNLPSFDSRHKNWIKTVNTVDTAKDNGYAFQGNFLKTGSTVELPIGTIIMYFYGDGSVKNYTVEVEIMEVTVDGLKPTGISTNRSNQKSGGWALDIRDELAEYMQNL